MRAEPSLTVGREQPVRVEVLLSTYNGGRWLADQLDSVLRQTHDDLTIAIRDDGSTDGMQQLIARLAEGDRRIRYSTGPNIGAAQSFLVLLRTADPDAGAIAFCDQDDVWEPNHISSAVTGLQAVPPETPTMWCSNVLVCDETLAPLRRHDVVRRGPSFANALVENIATGSTIVLNRAAADLLAQARPRSPVMHDAWCYLVVAALGQVIYDPRPSVRYRLHGSNAMGLSAGAASTQLARARRAWSGPHVRAWSRQAEDLRREYGDRLPAQVAAEVDAFLAGRTRRCPRLRYALTGSAHRQRPLGTAAMRLLHTMGRI